MHQSPGVLLHTQEALANEIKELERLLEQADTDLVVKDSELRNTKREKSTEINRLNALIAEKTDNLKSIRVLGLHVNCHGHGY
jgi:phosphate uptake regulator